MRLFFAAWPPAPTASALALWARGLEGRATPAEKVHLTLAFLGEAEPRKAIAAGRRASGRRHALPIETARYWKHNGIVWAGPVHTPPALAALVESLHRELQLDGFVLEPRPFAAHVTLVRKAPRPKVLPPLPRVDWPVEEMVLVRSVVSSDGSAYEIIHRFALED